MSTTCGKNGNKDSTLLLMKSPQEWPKFTATRVATVPGWPRNFSISYISKSHSMNASSNQLTKTQTDCKTPCLAQQNKQFLPPVKGKLHSKIISSDMKDFFRRIQWWRSEVEIRTGRRSNRRSKMAEKSRVTTPRGRHESLVQGVSSSRLRPDSDQSRIWCRARPWLVCDSLNELTWVSFVVRIHWHLTIFFFFFFFFFFLSFRECCLTRQWQSTECDTRYMVQRKKSDVILRFLVDRYRRTKPPKPDASQFVVPARLPKPVIGSGGLSRSRFDDDVPEVNCTWTASFSWRVKEAALWFESYGSKNLTGGTTQTSQSTSTDWLTRTHHWSSPRSKLTYKKPTSTRKLRKFPLTSGQGSKHRDWTASRWCYDDERDDDRSHRRVSIMSSPWRRLIPADHEYLDSVAWPCHDCEVAPVWHHDVTNVRTCQFFRRLFDRLPVRILTSDLHHRILRKQTLIISEIMILECSFPLRNSHFKDRLLLYRTLQVNCGLPSNISQTSNAFLCKFQCHSSIYLATLNVYYNSLESTLLCPMGPTISTRSKHLCQLPLPKLKVFHS